LSQAKATVPLLALILEAQLNRLDVLMGAQAGTYAAELEAPGEIPSVPSISTAANASDLLRRRPDIVAAERRLAASNARIGQAIAEYYPRVSLSRLLGNEAISPEIFSVRGDFSRVLLLVFNGDYLTSVASMRRSTKRRARTPKPS
jgi:outer membrane protein TolC